MDFKKQQLKTKICGDTLQPIKNRITPIVYTGMENQSTTIYFDDGFEFETIYNLISDIDSIRQIGGYSKINLYFSSNGGNVDCLFVLSDYLNQIDDIEIDFIVTGMVASAGFYILLMINNSNINIIFNDGCFGVLHLGDTWLSSRGRLSNDSGRYDWNKFKEKDINNLNNYFKTTYINKLKLSKEDRKRLNQGQDLHLDRNELSEVVYSFQEKRYYENGYFLNEYNDIKNQISELENLLNNIKDKYKTITGKDLT